MNVNNCKRRYGGNIMRKVRCVRFKTLNNRFGIKLSMGILILIIATGGAIQAKNAYANNQKIITQKSESKNKVVNVVKTLYAMPERPKYDVPLSQEYCELIWELCLKNDISYELVLATIRYESGFNSKIINRNKNNTYDIGLLQLNSKYIDFHRDLAIKYCEFPSDTKLDPTNPEHAIRAGIAVLVYARNYWIKQGVPDEYVLPYILGSFNQGINGFTGYMKRNNTIDTTYSNRVMAYKIKLETSNSLN